MEPSPAPRESPAKAAASEKVEPGSVARFKRLAKRLFAVDREEFRKALDKDERERRAKRGR
jgi:hypothetical protein